MGPDQAVVLMVLGCHRSGTSSLAGTISYLGGALPKNLMGAAESNPKGHFEPTDIADLHDVLLARAGSSWHDIAPFPPEWYSSPDFKKYVADLAETYRDNYGDAPLAILKDPRISRLIPLWQEVLKQLNISPKIIIINRSPNEVAKSLHVRDHFPVPLGLLIWLRNQLDAEYSTRHMQRVFVNYDDLMTNWRSVTTKVETHLDITFPGRGVIAQSNVDDFLESSLRHHNLSPGPGSTGVVIADWAQDAFSILSCDERVLSAAGRATLDRIRLDLDRATQAFSPLVEWQQQHLVDLRQQLDASRRAEHHLRQTGGDAEIERLRGASAAVEEAHQVQVSELARQLAERDTEILRLREASAATEAAYHAQAQDLSAEIANRNGEIAHLRQAAATAEEAHQAHIHDLSHHLAERDQKLAEREAEIVRLKFASAATEKAQQAQAIEFKRQLLENDVKLARWARENDRLAAEISTLSDEISAIYTSASWRLTAGLRWLAGDRQTPEGETTPIEVSAPTNTAPSVVSGAPDEASTLDPRILFDAHYYLDRYRDVRDSCVDPWEHYTSIGIQEGRNPNPLFDTAWYLERNPAISSAGENPLTHYLTRGAAEGLNPSPDFDGAWYLAHNPDVVAAGMNPLVHYLDHGRAEGRLLKGTDPEPATGEPPDHL